MMPPFSIVVRVCKRWSHGCDSDVRPSRDPAHTFPQYGFLLAKGERSKVSMVFFKFSELNDILGFLMAKAADSCETLGN
jgi:hypothetical protein